MTSKVGSNDPPGLGHHWLLKAQKHLAIIHREDGSSSSGTSNGRTGEGRSINSLSAGFLQTYTQQDDDIVAARAAVEAEARLQTAHYVEARGLLVPATDLLSAAVEAGDRQGRTMGDLLCLVRLSSSVLPLLPMSLTEFHPSPTSIFKSC